MWHFATKTRFKRRWTLILLALTAVILAGCGPVTVTNPDGSTSNIPYESWLATAESEDNLTAVQQKIGTFTPTATFTPSPTPTTTATITPIPPTATATPIPPFNGFYVVDNKIGQVVFRSEFQPECSGEWGYPGMDIWTVVNDVPVQKICGTPWNKPQNLAIKVIVIAFAVIAGFFIILVLSNEYRKWKQAQERKKLQPQPRQLTASASSGAGLARPSAESTDPVMGFIKLLGAHDKGLAEALLEFRRTHRRDLAGVHSVEQFAKIVADLDFILHQKIKDAIEKASTR
ncbi:hypothetical protein KBC80_02140 [Candidatus Woesebacteria bacterium]|jgi:hypothetical protein|nr:hypothetical protein [Candidatus Woesebacteria bacterium]